MSTEDQSRPAQVRCKFRCQSVNKTLESGYQKNPRFLYTYEFYAVTDGSDENKQYFAYTPSGSLKVGSFKDDLFEPGKEYYVDITPFIFVAQPPVEAAEEVE